ncbi:MAG: patatin-like phospholipase family protein [Planctomycetes bacterium]|nr:patatin-like phospholipase family protein [Planctomycetota bacterium]
MNATPDERPSEAPRDGGNILVLGGGGARGFAHFGVLEVLEGAGIRIDRIIGVSIGAFAGALYCQDPNALAVRQRVRDYVESEEFSRYLQRMKGASRESSKKRNDGASTPAENSEAEAANLVARNTAGFMRWVKRYLGATLAFHRFILKQAVLTHEPMLHCLKAIAKNTPIEELQVPLTIVAADLRSGSRVRIERGDLFSAVLGSIALPGIFPPIDRDGKLLADYGVLCSLPVSTAMRYRPAHVIAVDLTPDIEYRESFSSGLEIVNRMEEIGCYLFKEHIAGAADVLIRPDVSHVDWADFNDMDAVVERGIVATESVMPTLLKMRDAVPR